MCPERVVLDSNSQEKDKNNIPLLLLLPTDIKVNFQSDNNTIVLKRTIRILHLFV